MAEQITETTETTETTENVYEAKASTTEMTRAEYMEKEHQVQVGASTELPNGKSVNETFQSLINLQNKQETDLKERRKQTDAKSGIPSKSEFLAEKVEVSNFENGASSARPVVEKTVENLSDEPANDIPKGFPGRRHFLALVPPITRLEDIAKFDRDALIAINGIGATTADEILALRGTE